MLVYKIKAFNKWANTNNIADSELLDIVDEVDKGGFDANLGGNVYKKRVALGNKGKSSGARTILAFKSGDKSFFIFAFKKSDMDNVGDKELVALKEYAKELFILSQKSINKLIADKQLFLVESDNG